MLIKENRNYVILEAFDVTVKMCINKKCPDYAAEHETRRRTCAECGSRLVSSDDYYGALIHQRTKMRLKL